MDRSRFFQKLLMLLIFPVAFCRADPLRPDIQNCSAGNPAARQQCEEAFSRRVQSANRTTGLAGGWRLVKTPDPNGGTEAVSVMHVSDTAKSDLSLAGLTLRCGRGSFEVLLILLEPLPHGDNPAVIITNGPNPTQFDAAVIQGGEALLLPQAASSLAAGDWQKASELSIEIAVKPVPIRGIVPIAGLSSALQILTQNCGSR
jgi:hypothetical protein